MAGLGAHGVVDFSLSSSRMWDNIRSPEAVVEAAVFRLDSRVCGNDGRDLSDGCAKPRGAWSPTLTHRFCDGASWPHVCTSARSPTLTQRSRRQVLHPSLEGRA